MSSAAIARNVCTSSRPHSSSSPTPNAAGCASYGATKRGTSTTRSPHATSGSMVAVACRPRTLPLGSRNACLTTTCATDSAPPRTSTHHTGSDARSCRHARARPHSPAPCVPPPVSLTGCVPNVHSHTGGAASTATCTCSARRTTSTTRSSSILAPVACRSEALTTTPCHLQTAPPPCPRRPSPVIAS
eukprot:7300638-Prymnesium_polylepis.1